MVEPMVMADKEIQKALPLVLNAIKQNPSLLHTPELAYVKSFIEHFGGTVPKDDGTKEAKSTKDETAKSQSAPKASNPEPEPEVESEESDIELDMTGVIEADNDPPQKMGNPTLQPTDEEIDESQAKRSEAVSAFVEKDYEKAIALYTEAIVLNPQAALLYAKRGQIYLLMEKPNACIRDCNRALELNPDSAAAHKFRGRAHHLLGRFEEAAADLRLACKFDFDEQADEWLRAVTPNARKIEEHKRKKERKTVEKTQKEKLDSFVKMAESEGIPAPAPEFFQYLNDPDVIKAFQDPELAQAFKDICENSANILKYQNNPKVMEIIIGMTGKYGGAGGMPNMGSMPNMGAMPNMGSMPNMGAMPNLGAMGGSGSGLPDFWTTQSQPQSGRPKPSAPNPDDDVGLD